jgi:hypothetical protein
MKHIIAAVFSDKPDLDLMRNKLDKGLAGVSIRSAAIKYANHENGAYLSCVNKYWNALKERVKSRREGSGEAAGGGAATEADYLACLDGLELKTLGNTDFYVEAFFSKSEVSLLAVHCSLVGKMGFPLNHAQVQALAQSAARKILTERVVAGELESWVDLPSNLRCLKTGLVGDVPVCGEKWFKGWVNDSPAKI